MTIIVYIMINDTQKRKAVIFPSKKKILDVLGENIKLARKRRNLTQNQISQRTGLSRTTINKIEKGAPSVSIGHYFAVLSILDLAEDLANVAKDDEFGRRIQDAQLLAGKSAARKISDE